MQTSPEVTVIIPAYNAADIIGPCIESVLNQHFSEPFEVIVVDDGSTDQTAAIAEGFAGVRVLRQPNRGAAEARNHGGREARGWILCFIDSDCIATQEWLGELVSAIRCGSDGATGTFRTTQRQLIARFTQVEHEEKYDRLRARTRIDFVDTGSAAYRREVLLGVGEGGFDTIYPGASVEDHDFSFRLASLGCDLRFVPGAAVYHRHPARLSAYVQRKFNLGHWKVLVLARHSDRIVSDSRTPASEKVQILLFWGGLFCAIGGIVSRPLRAGAYLSLLGFMSTTVPFLRKAWRTDRAVAIISPIVLLARAGSLGAGLIHGALTLGPAIVRRRLQPTTPSGAISCSSTLIDS